MSTTDSSDLFHYTGTTGIKGILSTKKLWATDSHFLNDTSEGKIPDEILRRLSKMTNAYGLHYDLANKWLEEKAKRIPKSRFFVTCFCRHPDLLSQWRGYSAGLTGYALGFKHEMLKRFINHGSPRVEKCIYINDEGYRKLEDSFAKQLELVKVAFDKNQSPPTEGVFAEPMRWLEGPNKEQKEVCEALLDAFWDSPLKKLSAKGHF